MSYQVHSFKTLTEPIAKLIEAKDAKGFWDFIRARVQARLQKQPEQSTGFKTLVYTPLLEGVAKEFVKLLLAGHEQAIQVTWPGAQGEIMAAYDGRALVEKPE